MKHLKLYENFDRYEFGETKLSCMGDVFKTAVHFTESEKEEIQHVFNGILDSSITSLEFHTSSVGGRAFGEVCFYYNVDVWIRVIALGDFCYAVRYSNEDGVGNEYLYLVDTIEGIIPAIESLWKKDQENQ